MCPAFQQSVPPDNHDRQKPHWSKSYTNYNNTTVKSTSDTWVIDQSQPEQFGFISQNTEISYRTGQICTGSASNS